MQQPSLFQAQYSHWQHVLFGATRTCLPGEMTQLNSLFILDITSPHNYAVCVCKLAAKISIKINKKTA